MKTISKKFMAIAFGLTLVQFSCQDKEKSTTEVSAISEVAPAQLPHDNLGTPAASDLNVRIANELVCMVNDAFMGRKQFPVAVGDKIYYGCCEMCVGKLQNSDQYRYGIDPLTNEKVDKVEAYIVLASEETGAVYYFANEENYKKFKSKS
jgi:YHS domain-containing protein